MTGNSEEQELKDRLSLIESMIAQGRRTTESWGWTFVLWGVAYYVAIAWATWGQAAIAWPVTMIAAGIVTGIVASRMSSRRAGNDNWPGDRVHLDGDGHFNVLALHESMGISGRIEEHISVAVISAMLGTANATSSMILKWKMQFACAVVWWAAAVTACFVSEGLCTIAFLAAIFFCQIVFGIYAMVRESRRRRMQGAAHA